MGLNTDKLICLLIDDSDPRESAANSHASTVDTDGGHA
jgi:hypothetical protein